MRCQISTCDNGNIEIRQKGFCHGKIDKKQGRLEKEKKVGETDCETRN